MLAMLCASSFAAPGPVEVSKVLSEPGVREAFAAAVLAQADARPIGAFGGDLVYAVDLSAALADPTVDRALSVDLGLDVDRDLSGQVGLLLLPPQLVKEVGAYYDDGLIDLARATEMDQRTDEIVSIIVWGGAVILWGVAADMLCDAIVPPPPAPPASSPPKPADQPSTVDTTPNGCKSTTDCDGDGISNFYDTDDDGDGVPDDEPDNHPYDASRKICDLCGGTPYPSGAFSFFVGDDLGAVAEELTVDFLTGAAAAEPLSLGALAGGAPIDLLPAP